MSIVGTYLSAVSLYANWRTAVALGVVLGPAIVAFVVVRLANRKGRSAP